MGKLFCHTTLEIYGEICVEEGKSYEIEEENEKEYTIINESGDAHYFTKEPDDSGFSFANWLNLTGEEV